MASHLDGLTRRGIPLQLAHPGKVFWVNNSSVVRKRGVPANDSGSGTYQRPFATIDFAIGRCTANRGDVIIVRWADDFVVGFQYEDDAKRFHADLYDRFKKFSLKLHPEKTRLIRFGRFAKRDSRRFDGRKKPETFDFLGFTHYCGVNRNGKFKVCRITMKKRFNAKLHEVKAELRKRMHQSIAEQAK